MMIRNFRDMNDPPRAAQRSLAKILYPDVAKKQYAACKSDRTYVEVSELDAGFTPARHGHIAVSVELGDWIIDTDVTARQIVDELGPLANELFEALAPKSDDAFWSYVTDLCSTRSSAKKHAKAITCLSILAAMSAAMPFAPGLMTGDFCWISVRRRPDAHGVIKVQTMFGGIANNGSGKSN